MKTLTHRTSKRKYLRRVHPNNQCLVVDTSLGRKKPSPPPIPPRPPTIPVCNITTLTHSTNAVAPSYHYQPRRQDGPPSPPAHLRASIIVAPPPPSLPSQQQQQQQQQRQLPVPFPAYFVSHTSSPHLQQPHRQRHRHILPQYAIHAPAPAIADAASKRGSTSSSYYLPAYSLRPYQQQPQYITQNYIRKSGRHYNSTRSSQSKANRHAPGELDGSSSSSNSTHQAAGAAFFEPTMKISKPPWSPKEIYHAFRNNRLSNQQQQQQQPVLGQGQWQGHGQSRSVSEGHPLNFLPANVAADNANENNATKPATAKANKSCIHLGFAAYMITSFMLAYNGIMSVLLLQASRVPDDTNVPIFIFGLVFLFTTVLSIFGFLALSLSSRILIRVFHTMYLFTATLTFVLMLSWLGVNEQQTGSWDRVMLDHVSFSPSTLVNTSKQQLHHEMWLKSLLTKDLTKEGTWIISPLEWILAFLGILVIQCASWYWGLLAYDRQLLDRKLRDKKSNKSSGNHLPFLASEKV